MTPLLQQLREVAGTWGRPPDEAAQGAAAFAALALLLVLTGRGRSLLGLGEHPLPRRLFLWASAFAAALLSVGYIAIYLRGGPRIIDATTYFLQGRALSHGELSWPVVEPSASFRGRFLLFREDAAGSGVMGGIFPPGYPLLLAIAFKIGAPMVIGPVIAASLVLATYRFARTLAEDALGKGVSADVVEVVARTAALVSVVCGALRYHTADTMAHGATALGIVIALEAALRGRGWLAGLAIGAVVATRPVSAVGVGVVVLALVAMRAPRRELGRLLLGLLPGVLLLVVGQHAVTGSWLSSSQKMYYATSDGPPGCFRWGFGAGTGCLFEHGDFVEARLKGGYGPLAAVGTTLRRLRMHLLDVGNLEPLALLVLVPLLRLRGAAKRSPAVVASLVVVLLHVLAHAGFYFDGNYPGGGARFFADLLPIEHALLAVAAARLVGSSHVGHVDRVLRGAFALLALSLAGFAVHAVFGHRSLSDREGGRPMFEPDLLVRANITNGLVFVDTDHGFALGYDPAVNVKKGVLVARLHNDDRDRLLYDRLDHPPTFLYHYDVPASPAVPVLAAGQPPPPLAPPPVAVPTVVAWAPPALNEPARFEMEAEWPPLSQAGGYAIPVAGEPCLSGGRALALTPTPLDGHATATLALPVPAAGSYLVTVRMVQGIQIPHTTSRGEKLPSGVLSLGTQRWEWIDVAGGQCADLPAREVVLTPPFATLTFEARDGTVTLDKVTLKRLP